MSKEAIVKITSDGTTSGTRFTLEDGAVLGYIERADISMDEDEDVLTAKITVWMTPVELLAVLKEAIATYWVCPKCGKKWCSEWCPCCGEEGIENTVLLTELVAEDVNPPEETPHA